MIALLNKVCLSGCVVGRSTLFKSREGLSVYLLRMKNDDGEFVVEVRGAVAEKTVEDAAPDQAVYISGKLRPGAFLERQLSIIADEVSYGRFESVQGDLDRFAESLLSGCV